MSHNALIIFCSHWNLNIIWNTYELFIYVNNTFQYPNGNIGYHEKLKTSSYCSEQARHLSSEWIIDFFPDPFAFYGVRAPASAAVTGAVRRVAELCVCLSESVCVTVTDCVFEHDASAVLSHFQETSEQSHRFLGALLISGRTERGAVLEASRDTHPPPTQKHAHVHSRRNRGATHTDFVLLLCFGVPTRIRTLESWIITRRTRGNHELGNRAMGEFPPRHGGLVSRPRALITGSRAPVYMCTGTASVYILNWACECILK